MKGTRCSSSRVASACLASTSACRVSAAAAGLGAPDESWWMPESSGISRRWLATRRRAEAEAAAVAERAAAEVERAGAERAEVEARLRGEAERAHVAARDEAWKLANSRRNLGAQLAALAQESTAAKQVSSPPP